MTDKKIEIRKKYSHELHDIKNKLDQLRNGRVYEISNVKSDGYISTNIDQLEKSIANLLSKVENGEDSFLEFFSKQISE